MIQKEKTIITEDLYTKALDMAKELGYIFDDIVLIDGQLHAELYDEDCDRILYKPIKRSE